MTKGPSDMRIALYADVHANREALTACMADAARRGARRAVFLGDLVGYGADPAWVVDLARDAVQRGALAVLGNHDEAVAGTLSEHMQDDARVAVEWSQTRLDAGQLAFLRQLPLTATEGPCLFVHANAVAPAQWGYIHHPDDARRSMTATASRYTFCGHVHEPTLFNLTSGGHAGAFNPVNDTPVPLNTLRRWLAIPGSVGQPRDGNPAACYGILDLYARRAPTLTFCRVPYDHEGAARKIFAAGLPERFATRLLEGR